MESAALTTRRIKGIERKGNFEGCHPCFPLSRRGESQTVLLLAFSRREGRRCDAPGIAFPLLAAWGDRSCQYFVRLFRVIFPRRRRNLNAIVTYIDE
jgi:hypothetical protein